MSENSVKISVFPITGAPSCSVPLPINNWRVSTAQPSSAPANCGRFSINPLRLVILEICTMAIYVYLFDQVFMLLDSTAQLAWSIPLSNIQIHRLL